MKKVIWMFLTFISAFSLASCDTQNINRYQEITCEDIIRVYGEAGYEIFHKETINQ